MSARFEIFEDSDQKLRFRLRATNGEIIATSEAYVSLSGCRNGIASVRMNAPAAAIIDLREPRSAAARAPGAPSSVTLSHPIEYDGEEFEYRLTYRPSRRLPGAEVHALLDQRRAGLSFPGQERDTPFVEAVFVRGPFTTLDEPTVRAALGERAEPWHKDEGVWSITDDEQLIGIARLNDEGRETTDANPGGAFVATLHGQLEQLTGAAFVDWAPRGKEPVEGKSPGTFKAWILGLAVDGSLVGVRATYVWT